MRARNLSSPLNTCPREIEKRPARIAPVWAEVAGLFWHIALEQVKVLHVLATAAHGAETL